mgnify:CR=1 FL=1
MLEASGIPSNIVNAMKDKGYEKLTTVQEEVIKEEYSGLDLLVSAQTGSGKTIAFGLPLLQLLPASKPGKPTGLALVPTRELAVQVCKELEPLALKKGLRTKAIYGGTPIEKQIDFLKRGVDFVVATPGRLIDLLERGDISVKGVEKIVIDEADRMADMGFMPQVEWILRQVEVDHQTLLFSATLDGMVSGLISRYQQDPAMHEVDSREVTVAEMQHRFIAVHEMDQVKVAASIINSSKKTIVFTKTRWGADKLASKLLQENVTAAVSYTHLTLPTNREV